MIILTHICRLNAIKLRRTHWRLIIKSYRSPIFRNSDRRVMNFCIVRMHRFIDEPGKGFPFSVRFVMLDDTKPFLRGMDRQAIQAPVADRARVKAARSEPAQQVALSHAPGRAAQGTRTEARRHSQENHRAASRFLVLSLACHAAARTRQGRSGCWRTLRAAARLAFGSALTPSPSAWGRLAKTGSPAPVHE